MRVLGCGGNIGSAGELRDSENEQRERGDAWRGLHVE